MKRFILAILIAITLAVLIGSLAYYSGPGYVVFSFAEYTVETSFIFMLGFVAIGFYLFYYLLRFISTLMNIPSYLGSRHIQRQHERSRNSLIKGLIEISEGRFEQAEKMFLKRVGESETALLNYLMAARAAQQLGAYDRRDEYLRLAHESTPSADIAIGLTQAELQLSHKQYEQALATLNHLSGVAPKHRYVKRLLAQTYQRLGDWESLGQMLEELRKHKAMGDEQFHALELETYHGMLNSSIKRVDGDSTERIWKSLPKSLRNEASLIKLYASYLKTISKDTEAEAIIRGFMSDEWDDELAYLYSELNGKDCKRQLETAETWLHNQPRNGLLLMVLGKLSLRCELWGKAKSYFETSISIANHSEAYLQLAVLLEEKMEQPEEAQKIYQQGLAKMVESQNSGGGLLLPKSESTRSTAPVLKVIQ